MAEVNVKEVVTEFDKAFEEFKKANDERLDRLEKGEAVSDLDSKIGKIEEKYQNSKGLFLLSWVLRGFRGSKRGPRRSGCVLTYI